MRPCWRAGGDGGEVAGATLELVGRQQGREGSEGRRTAMREEGGRQVGGRETEADFEGGVLQWPKGLSWYVAALHAREREGERRVGETQEALLEQERGRDRGTGGGRALGTQMSRGRQQRGLKEEGIGAEGGWN
jgi:hypothetical protein